MNILTPYTHTELIRYLLPPSHRTFAYKTLIDRMPKILTQVIDTVHREERSLLDKHGEVCCTLLYRCRLLYYTVAVAQPSSVHVPVKKASK